MKIKLAYKFFVAFLLTSFLAVALLVGTMQFYLSRHFADYVNRTAMERLDPLTNELSEEYRTHQGWGDLIARPDRWQNLLFVALSKGESSRRNTVSADTEGGRSSPTDSRAEGSDLSRRILRLARGLALFDDQKRLIAGRNRGPVDTYTLTEITVDDRTVGWLGLHKREHLSSPLVVSFLREQSLVFYEIGAGILLLAAVVSFLLAKHLLAPVRQLTQGTRELREFKFDAKIEVSSKDELGQLAADFNTMADTLRRYEEMRRHWISDISHELRTPLAILRGEIEALQDGVREPGEETLNSLHAEVVRLGKLVEDLHLLSLADSLDLLMRKETVEPLEILQQMVAQFHTRLEGKRIEVRLALDGGKPILLKGDPGRLAQLFSNLLENTVRYTDSPGWLKIHAGRDGDRLEIVFEDSAPGVPPGALDRLFDRLYRVEGSRSRALGGSGLGLAISKEIVEAHGGTVRASNSSSGGLSIRMEFPLDSSLNR